MKRTIPILPWLGALLLIAIVLICYESDLLWKVQQYNLFLDTSLFFREQMLVPGGFLSYISCYFTQYFYHPWLGVTILCGWWLLLMWLTKRAFQIADHWTILALIPIAILIIADMSLGYWHYFMKLRGYFFVPTIGTTVAVAMLWGFRSLQQNMMFRLIYVVTATAIGYPLFGIYSLVATLLMGIWIWRLASNRSQNALLTFISLLCIVAIPLIFYRYVYYQTYFNDLWTANLPAFIVQESYPVYYIPYYILGGFFLLMVIFYQASQPSIFKKSLYRWGIQGILIVSLIGCIWHWWYKDDNFHHELVMQHCIEQADWEGVINECQKQDDDPTSPIIMMRNLALQRLGRQLDEIYNFPKGRKKSNTTLPFNMLYHVFGRTIYYQYGLLNDCHRRCMEDGVEYGWHVEIMQYMARCSMMSSEKQAAQKILNLLRHTKYHGEWADNIQQLLDHTEQITDNRETCPISHMLYYKNAIGSDGGNVEKYVMNQLSRQDSNDPYFQEQAVLATLWLRNNRLFWSRFAKYTHLYPQGPIPRIFQEAAYLFGNIDKMPFIERYPFDKEIKDCYKAFMKEAMKYDGQSADIGRAALKPYYGNTYYFEYYFMKLTK